MIVTELDPQRLLSEQPQLEGIHDQGIGYDAQELSGLEHGLSSYSTDEYDQETFEAAANRATDELLKLRELVGSVLFNVGVRIGDEQLIEDALRYETLTQHMTQWHSMMEQDRLRQEDEAAERKKKEEERRKSRVGHVIR